MQRFQSEAEFGQQQWRISLVGEIPKIMHSKKSIIAATTGHMSVHAAPDENTCSEQEPWPKDERDKKSSQRFGTGADTSVT